MRALLRADTHKRLHTIAAVHAATGQVLGDKTVAVGARGGGALAGWARSLGVERVWALEDCVIGGSHDRPSEQARGRVARRPPSDKTACGQTGVLAPGAEGSNGSPSLVSGTPGAPVGTMLR